MWIALTALGFGILLIQMLKWKVSCLAVLLYMGEKGFKYPDDGEMKMYTSKAIRNMLNDHKLK